MAVVGVIGLGYVGLPAALLYAEAGFLTLGFDVDWTKIAALAVGASYLRHVPSERVVECLDEKGFEPTADMTRLAEADVILICVPTPLSASRDPDLSHVIAAARQVAHTLRAGQLVILESTSYPGTTHDVLLPILEATGLHLGVDFFVAFAPEREDPGNTRHSGANIPKVVGGCEPASLELAQCFYEQAFVSVTAVSSCEAAEATKMLENTYRAVNIALVNELKMLFDRLGIDIWEVIEAAKTKPFGFQAFSPGPGLGGHCIPIDPFYLSYLARRHDTSVRFIELAGEINTRMPEYVFERLLETLNERGKALNGSRVCLLGVAYKPDIDDVRGSPALPLLRRLQAGGAKVSYHDPYVERVAISTGAKELASVPLSEAFLAAQDVVLIVTAHTSCDYDWIVEHASLVIDTRNATRLVIQGREKIRKA